MSALAVPVIGPPVLGVGAFYKPTLCLIAEGQATLSPPLEAPLSAAAIIAYEQAANTLLATLKAPLACVAHDLHPDFFSTRFAEGLDVPLLPVQHHHAHVAAVMAEHQLRGPVLGLAFDGFGLGPQKASWGGELLLLNEEVCTRLGRLRPLPQPGGDQAARAPWRMGAAALWAMGRGHEISARYQAFSQAPVLQQMLQNGLHSPMTSSAGRLFDAACGLLGLKLEVTQEGEAPMALEKLVSAPRVLEGGWQLEEKDGLLELDLRPLLEKLCTCEAKDGAELFHGTLAAAVANWVDVAGAQHGVQQVVYAGGCFLNRVLVQRLTENLTARGFVPYQAGKVSPGDASISLGQAYVAAWAVHKGQI